MRLLKLKGFVHTIKEIKVFSTFCFDLISHAIPPIQATLFFVSYYILALFCYAQS